MLDAGNFATLTEAVQNTTKEIERNEQKEEMRTVTVCDCMLILQQY
jgi:hypothetical protein